MLERRLITAEEFQKEFSDEELKTLFENNQGVPYHAVEIETDDWLARFYKVSFCDVDGAIFDLTDKETNFKITRWASEIIPLFIDKSKVNITGLAINDIVMGANMEQMAASISNFLKRIKGSTFGEPERYKGIPLRPIKKYGVGKFIGKEKDFYK